MRPLFASLLPLLVTAAATTAAIPASAQQAPAPAPAPAWGAPPHAGPWAPPYAIWVPLPATERRSPGMMIAGITLFSVGGVTQAIGAGLFFNALANPCILVEDRPTTFNAPPRARTPRIGVAQEALGGCDNSSDVGAVVMGIGTLLGLAGVPLFVVGNSRVQAHAQPEDSALPAVRVGANRAVLQWTF